MTTREMLFGTKLNPVCRKEMARIVGCSHTTIGRWREDPDMIPWGKMKVLIRLRKLTPDDLMKMAREK